MAKAAILAEGEAAKGHHLLRNCPLFPAVGTAENIQIKSGCISLQPEFSAKRYISPSGARLSAIYSARFCSLCVGPSASRGRTHAPE